MRIISLFTGAGGFDLGLEAAGFEVAVAVESDPIAGQTLATSTDWRVLPHDIHGLTSSEILAPSGLGVGEATLLVGGPPCQPFSKSAFWAQGDVKRLGDPRASTIEEFLRVLADTKPLAFMLENVPGFGYRQKDEGLRLLKERVAAINASRSNAGTRVNYSCEEGVLDALDFGVPQRRSRMFVIGHREGTRFEFAEPTHVPLAPTTSQESLELGGAPYQRNAWDAIGRWEDDDDPALRPTGKWAALLPSIPEGENYLHMTERGGGQPLFGWRRRYWSFLLKLSKRLPAWTITAQPGPATGPFHWKNRRLSARELCALQTFPEGYHVEGDLRAVHRQVGNAVPSALAEHLGLEIRRQFLGETDLDTTARRRVASRQLPVPPPEDPEPIPSDYHDLIGEHAAHPGPGLGPGAKRREHA